MFPDGRRVRRSPSQNETPYETLPIDVIHFGDQENLIRLNPGKIKPTPTNNLIIGKQYKFRHQLWDTLTYRGIRAIPIVTVFNNAGWQPAYVFQTIDGFWYGILKDFADQQGLYSIKSIINLSHCTNCVKNIGKPGAQFNNAQRAAQFFEKNEDKYHPDSKSMKRVFEQVKQTGLSPHELPQFSHSFPSGELNNVNWNEDLQSYKKRKKLLEFGKNRLQKRLQKSLQNRLQKRLQSDLKRLMLIK